MSGNGMREYQDERATTAPEAEEAAPEADVAPVISPAQAGAMLSGKLNKVQRQAIIQSVGQHYGNRQVQRLVNQAQRSASAGPEGGPLESELISRIQSERSGGQPMDASVRRQIEGNLGQDLSPVRVHTGSSSAELNRQMGAKAFTTGRDIFLGEGASPTDTALLTHEATHTIQQGMGEAAPSSIGAADTEHEHAAEHNAAHHSEGGLGVQREAEEEELQMMRDTDVQREAEEDELQMMRDPEVQREAEEEEEESVERMMEVQREGEEEEEEGTE